MSVGSLDGTLVSFVVLYLPIFRKTRVGETQDILCY